MTINYSIVVPCYNEEKNIPLILESFKKAIDKSDVEVILVNNGSTDQSQKILDELIPQYPFSKSVLVEKNIGYGHGIVSGLKSASGSIIGYTHADLQTDPADVIKAFTLMASENNPKNLYIKGVRKKRKLGDTLFSFSMALFETILFQKILFEINAQPNVFHRDFFAGLKDFPDDFSLDLFFYINAIRQKMTIKRIDVLFPERIHGESKWKSNLMSKINGMKRAFFYSIKLRCKRKECA